MRVVEGVLLAATVIRKTDPKTDPNIPANALVVDTSIWGKNQMQCVFHVGQLYRLRTAEKQDRLSVFSLAREIRR